MKKAGKIVVITLMITTPVLAQNNVGIGTLSPNPKAILDLSSNSKGFLAPRMTSTERQNIQPSLSEQGLLVFDTDVLSYFFWNGQQWVQLPGPAGYNTSLTFVNNILSLTDGGGTLSVPINFVNNDNDSTNELITDVVFSSNDNILTIVEGGNTWATSINVNDADSDPTNELIANVTFNPNGNILSITEAGNTFNTTLNINVNDADSDPTNEWQTLSLSGNTLIISNGNSVSLATFVNTDNQTLSLSGTQLSISNGNSVDLSNIGGNDWKLTGNANTNVTTNYIGTSDAVGLSIRTNATERIRITANTGYVGIGVIPAFLLDVGDRMRLRAGANGTAGTWFTNTANTQNRAFIGMIDDDRIGIYGAGMANWHFRANVNDGSTFIWGKTTISRDNIGECCNNDATLALAENTASTGRVASISFHNANQYQGQLSLVNDATGLGIIAGRLRLSTSGLTGGNMGLQITGGLFYGNSDSRTETRSNAGLQGNDGAQSGFFEFNQPSGNSASYNYPAGYSGNTWWHLIDTRHSNPNNNYALQIAGNFFDQRLFFRKTNNNPATSWNEFVTSVNVNSFIINNNAPFITIVRYNFGNADNITYNTGYSATQYSAVIAGMNSAQPDQNMTSIRCYMFRQSGTWWIRYDNRSSVDNLEFIDVMFINSSVVVSDNR